jgi:hypothetical protein
VVGALRGVAQADATRFAFVKPEPRLDTFRDPVFLDTLGLHDCAATEARNPANQQFAVN